VNIERAAEKTSAATEDQNIMAVNLERSPASGESVDLEASESGLRKADLELTQGVNDPSRQSNKASFWYRQLPYIIVLTLAIVGVAYTNMSHQPLVGYWEFLGLTMGVVCIVTEWPKAGDKQARFRLVWTQAAHWVAILVTMNIMLLSGVQQLLPSLATSLVLLMLLALGTFLAGLNFLLLPLCFLGLALALAVPVISWLKQSVLFFVLAAVFVIGLGMTFWPRQAGRRANSEKQIHQLGT
jgi:hypothetical protein